MMYQPPPGTAPVVVLKEQKSVALAIVLAFFFGPLGMFYGTVTGALVMLSVNLALFLLGFVTFGLTWFLFFFTWVGGIIWAAVEANSSNQRLVTPVVPVVPVVGVVTPVVMPVVYQMPPVLYPQAGYPPSGALQPPYQGQPGTYQPPGLLPPPPQTQSGYYQQPGSASNPYPPYRG